MAFLEGFIDFTKVNNVVDFIGQQLTPEALQIRQSDPRNTAFAAVLAGDEQAGSLYALSSALQVGVSLTVESSLSGPVSALGGGTWDTDQTWDQQSGPWGLSPLAPQAVYAVSGIQAPSGTWPYLAVPGSTTLQSWNGTLPSWLTSVVVVLSPSVDLTKITVFFEVSNVTSWTGISPDYVNLLVTNVLLTVAYSNGLSVEYKPQSWTLARGINDVMIRDGNNETWNIEVRASAPGNPSSAGYLALFDFQGPTADTEGLIFHFGASPLGSIYPDEGLSFSGTTDATGSIYPDRVKIRWIQDKDPMGTGIAR